VDPSDVDKLVARALRLLPAQAPLTSFIHHNPLHVFEHLPFERALAEAGALYGNESWLEEERYREEIEAGRIRHADLESIVRSELGPRAGERVARLVTRLDLRMTMLFDPVRTATEAELQWLVAAGDGARAFRRRCPPTVRRQMVADSRLWVMRDLRSARDRRGDDVLRATLDALFARFGPEVERWTGSTWDEVTLTLLWRICLAGVSRAARVAPPPPAFASTRLRDPVLHVTGRDPDVLVHETLIRFCGAFADQGLAAWPLPRRDLGFWRSFLALHGAGFPLRDRWLRALPREVARLERDAVSAEVSIEESLRALEVDPRDRERFVAETLLALRGWAGMLRQLELRPDRVRWAPPGATILELLAVRLVLDRLAARHLIDDTLGPEVTFGDVRRRSRPAPGASGPTARAFAAFLLAQSLGWSPRRLAGLSPEAWAELVAEIDAFPAHERRRVFHEAYELRYRTHVLDALATYRPDPPLRSERPRFHLVTCIDEREESLRRHVEEIEPGAETSGCAGFFGVAMYWRGIDDARETPLCPVAIRPRHRVREAPMAGHHAAHARRATLRRGLGFATHRVHAGSHGFAAGALASLVGAAAAAPLVGRVLFPRLASRLRRHAAMLVTPPVDTELVIESAAAGTEDARGVRDGFTPGEMAAIVGGVLRDIGLVASLPRIVVLVGHGSASLNNPHETAHDCGACGGGRGGPNARAFAWMANRADVRERMRREGIDVSADTVFVGAYHDTCEDSVVHFDVDRVPASHRADLRHVVDVLDRACERNAHERCRRFRSAPLEITPAAARRHVEARAQDLAQPRPEFGHATNAFCVVGRRWRTRGLFLDRRAFLVSYDPAADAADPASPILARILSAIVPVTAGIGLEYWFSYVDPDGWGCGTKLPHNVAALVGVMDGAASDLRTGLPWQMVEIHDPLRPILVVESSPSRLVRLLERNEPQWQLCRNPWLFLASLDPDSSRVSTYDGSSFREHHPETGELPVAPSSLAWYGGLREHLDIAVVDAARGSGSAT
jgi:uncharacterized protein YbcC (UPF0753/DUF2309 family)